METEDRIMGKQDAKLIIFDMDGVILDSEPLHENARQMMFKKYGIVPDEKMPEAVGTQKPERIIYKNTGR